jgi:hypothetical protein
VKFAASAPLNAAAVTIDRSQDPTRVHIRCGSVRLILTPAETVILATRLVDIVADLRDTEGVRR